MPPDNCSSATTSSIASSEYYDANKRTRLQTQAAVTLDPITDQIVDIIKRSEGGVQQAEIAHAIPRQLLATQRRLKALERLGIIVSVHLHKRCTYYFLAQSENDKKS